MNFVWQQKRWPNAMVDRAALKDELVAFKDALSRAGEEGVKAGLSASKWMRMAKVSKRSAERDIAELSVVGAVVAVNDGPQTRYQLNCVFSDGAIEPLNERLVRLVATHPGTQLAYLASVVSQSRATVKRAVAALVKSGKVEHRGSKKTGGYYAVK